MVSTQETLQIHQWRFDQLFAFGVPADLAAELAMDESVDIHELFLRASELVSQGCDLTVAVQIAR